MIYKKSIILPLLLLAQITNTADDHIIIEIDDKKTKELESLLQEKKNLINYIKVQQDQQWAEYNELTNCCCLTALCIPSFTQCIEPFSNVAEQISMITALLAGASILAIDRLSKPNCSKQEARINKIDAIIKEKFE